MTERICANCKYWTPIAGALACMGQKYMPYVRPTDSCGSWKPEKQANYDRIVSMTPEELARFIRDQIIDRNIGIPTESWLDWLKSPVEVDNGKG